MVYPLPGVHGVKNLFLAFTGWVIGSDGSGHRQYWEVEDFKPVIAHIDRSTMTADDEMFTDFLFLGLVVKNASGSYKHIDRNEASPGNMADWNIYLNELFAPGKNINALYTISRYNGLGRQIAADVWIGLPYPNPKIFISDYNRISSVCKWIDSFISFWNAGSYSNRLNLRGFYWVQESEYFNTRSNSDSYVMTRVNRYIHSKYINGRQLKALWIPYQKAVGWNQWKSFGFDLSVLQPSHYFNPKMNLETGACDSYANGLGVEMELDLAVTYDKVKRARFIEYLDKGSTGGKDSAGRQFGAYMKESVLAWYMGGWSLNNGQRNHCIHKLFRSGDDLYDNIWDFVRSTYKYGRAN